MGFVVAAVKVAAAFVAKNAIAKTIVKLAATALISKVATKSISKLIAKRDGAQGPSGSDAGGRVQLPPATDNKLPIVYGSAWLSGPIIDAKISVDQKYMWYVMALCEKPDGQTITFDTSNGVYYAGKKVTFGSNGVVNALVTNTTTPQSDTRMAGKIYIWLFQDDAASTTGSNSSQTPYQIMTDSTTGGGIQQGWNDATIYTASGQSVQLNNMAYAIIRVEYNPDAGTTGFDSLQIKVTNNMGASGGCKPGTAILDFLTNERYGCAIPLENVDTASLTALNTYSDQTITYTPVGGGSASQSRYRVNGPLDTGNPCLTNLQFLADTCDSWIQYTETTGKWRIVPNKPYTGTLASLYNINDNVLIGGIQINPIDLNDTYNQVEIAYPNTNVKDQTDYQIVDLTDPTTAWYATFNQVLSPNEAINRLNITLPLVNNAVQAKYLGVRRLLQSREDLVITCQLDYSGIQIDAGDVIRVNHDTYGWTDKLFRVSSVSEVQDDQGNLSAQIEAFEYNGEIYDDNALQDFVPADNTGLSDPNVISLPCPPTITSFTDANGLITGFTVQSCVPEEGTVLYMDFNYGTSNSAANHQLYRTVQAGGGQPFVNSPDIANANITAVSITVNDLPAANYYWSATARNDTAGRYSDGSAAYTWGGANIQPYNPISNTGGISGGQVKNGTLTGNNIAGNTITYNNMSTGLTVGQYLVNYSYSVSAPAADLVFLPVDLTSMGTSANLVAISANGFFSQPKYLIGTDVNANYFYPYYQNTSTTANGYLANSTSQFYPADATQYLDFVGTDNWWPFDFGSFSTVPASEYVQITWRGQFVSNANTSIQITRFIKFSSQDTEISFQTDDHLHTIELLENKPQYIYYDAIASGSGSIDGAGLAIRNMDANSNVTIMSGRLMIARYKF